MRAYVYLVLISQVQARSSIVGMSVVDDQQVFKSKFNALINEDYSSSVDIHRYQSVLEHTLSKVDFSIVMGIYMLLINLKLNTEKTAECNNKILISSANMKIDLDRYINKAKAKS